jgi:hypothetical protein
MTVTAWRDAEVKYQGRTLGKVYSADLQRSRDKLDSTTLADWDESWVPGRLEGTITVSLYYDPVTIDASSILTSLLNNSPESDALVFSCFEGQDRFTYSVVVEAVAPAVQVNNVTSISATLRLKAPGNTLIVQGASSVFRGDIRTYTASILDAEAPWTFTWEIVSGTATLSATTGASINITFTTLGTVTLRTQATLGATVLTKNTVITVTNAPLFWYSRTTDENVIGALGSDSVARCVDNLGNTFYMFSFKSPSTNTDEYAVIKWDRLGAVQWAKRINWSDPWIIGEGLSLQNYGYGVAIVPDNNGGCMVFYPIHALQFRLGSAGNLVWATSNDRNIVGGVLTGSDWDRYPIVLNAKYIPEHDAVYLGTWYVTGGGGRGAMRAYRASDGRFMNSCGGLSGTTTNIFAGTGALSANWPSNFMYNPINNTVVTTTRDGFGPDPANGIHIREAPAFMGPTSNPTFTGNYVLTSSTDVTVSLTGSRASAIAPDGTMYLGHANGVMLLDPSYNCIKAVNRGFNTVLQDPPGVGILPSGELVRAGATAWEVYSADLSTVRTGSWRGLSSINQGSFGSTFGPSHVLPGGTRQDAFNPVSGMYAVHALGLGTAQTGIAATRLFAPDGLYELSGIGTNSGIGVRFDATQNTIEVATLPTRSLAGPPIEPHSVPATANAVPAGFSIIDEPELSWISFTYTIP